MLLMTNSATRGRLRFIGLLVFLVLLGVLALLDTSAIASSFPGRVGSPEVTIPVAEREPADRPLIRLAVLGDVGTGEAGELAVARRVATVGAGDPFDALVLLGDNVYPDGDPSRLGATVFGPFGPVLDGGAALLPVIGNHDAGFADEQVAALGMPGRWYANEIGDILFLGLDSTDPENPAQLAWLERTLATSRARWIVAAMHHPPFSAGAHGSNRDTREAFVPLFERYGVDLVLAGHDHDYQRSIPIGGITYVVSGGGAKVRATGSADFTATSAAVLHFVDLGVWEDRMELTAISLAGTFDHVVIRGNEPVFVTAASFTPTGLFEDEPSTGIRMAGVGALFWLIVIGTGWMVPRATMGRFGRVLLVISTVSMLTVLTGVGLVTASLVT
jgi:3',5'-cyclic AMP phosphodiesterase CpdA